MSDFYCECDVEVSGRKKCQEQCATCSSLEARAIVEYEIDASLAFTVSNTNERQ